MDKVLSVGAEERLTALLAKLGNEILIPSESAPLSLIVSDNVVDLILLGDLTSPESLDLLGFFRENPSTQRVPIVCLADNEKEKAALEGSDLTKIECLQKSSSPGLVAAKVSTLLRLRKFDGADPNASLDELNASLRDVNERLLHERKEATKIQEALLPSCIPSSASFDIAVHYAPLENIGGDWYFVEEVDSSHIVAQIADVTGHGLAAALLSSMMKLARTCAWNREPEKLLEGMNQLLCSHMPEGRFVTMCALSLAQDSGELQISGAAHPPAMILRKATSTCEVIQNKGFPLGFFDTTNYVSFTYTLEPGDAVAIFTDGVNEAINRGNEMFGDERICAALSKAPEGSSAEELIRCVFQEFDSFIDGRLLKDDITFLVIKRRE
jgi:phosphoserine phosphatase RsbU/P